MCCSWFFTVVCALLCVKGVWCLRMLALHAPSRIVVGQTIRLTCKFDLEGDTLYSINWYRNDLEFYRYVPHDSPPQQYLPMKGVRVDMLHSVNNLVILKEIDTSTSGNFKCGVSADAPSFETKFVETELTVKEYDDDDDDDDDDDENSSCSPSCGWLSLSSFLITMYLL